MRPGRARAERLEEALAVIRRMHRGGRFSFEGSWYRLREMEGGPAPVQDPMPVLVGAGSPTMLAIAARGAEIVSISRSMVAGTTPAEVARDATARATAAKVARVREAAGDRFDRLELHILVTLVEIGPGSVAAAQAFADATGLTVEETMETPQHLLGSETSAAEQLQARRERYGISYVAVDEHRLEAFAPVVAALAGT